MPSKETEKKRGKISSQGMIDHSPASGKSSFIKLPEKPKLRFFVPEKGKTYRMIFIPWLAGVRNPAGKKGEWVTQRYIPVHKGIGPSEQTYICSARAFGKPCSVCEGFAEMRNRHGWDGYEKYKDLKYKDREIFLLADWDEIQAGKKNPMIWEESIHLFGDSLRSKVQKKPIFGYYADFDDGSIVEFEAAEKKTGKFSCVDCGMKGIEMEQHDGKLPEWLIQLAETICVDDFVVETPYKDLKRLFGSTAPTQEDDEVEDNNSEEDPPPVRRKTGPVADRIRARRAEVEAEEEVDPDPEEEPVAEEEPAPKVKKPSRNGKKPAAKKPDPEEEEENDLDEGLDEEEEIVEDDIEDEEPTPRPKKRK